RPAAGAESHWLSIFTGSMRANEMFWRSTRHLIVRSFVTWRPWSSFPSRCASASLRWVRRRGRCTRILTASIAGLSSGPPRMRQARAFVQHSVEASTGDCEGLPVGILEAGASGLPVIATRHAGIPEAVVDGETGVLVAEKDVRGMAHAMAHLLKSPELAGRLG